MGRYEDRRRGEDIPKLFEGAQLLNSSEASLGMYEGLLRISTFPFSNRQVKGAKHLLSFKEKTNNRETNKQKN